MKFLKFVFWIILAALLGTFLAKGDAEMATQYSQNAILGLLLVKMIRMEKEE